MSDRPGCSKWNDEVPEVPAAPVKKDAVPIPEGVGETSSNTSPNGPHPHNNNVVVNRGYHLPSHLFYEHCYQIYEEAGPSRLKTKKNSTLRINPMVFIQNPVKSEPSPERESDLNTTPESNDNEPVRLETLSFNVEITCKLTASRGPKILEISCEPVLTDRLNVPNRDSLSSGNLADVSQSVSSASSSVHVQMPRQSSVIGESQASTSSGGSSIPASAIALALKRNLKMSKKHYKRVCTKRIKELSEKWHKSDMIYHILDFVDKYMCPEDTLDSRKRPYPHNFEHPPMKRLRKFHLDPNLCQTIMGKEVYAKREDGNYYYGIVTGMTKIGDLDVDFNNRNHLCVSLNNVITNLPCLVTNSVMVFEIDKKSTYPGLVSDHYAEISPSKFNILSDFGDNVVNSSQLFLTQAQVHAIEMALRANGEYVSTDLDLNLDMIPDYSLPGPSGLQQIPAGSGSGTGTDTDDPSGSGFSTDIDAPLSYTPMNLYKYVVGCDTETSNAGVLNSLLKLKGIAGKIPKRGSPQEDEILGPLTVSGTWFNGYNFILTCSIQNMIAPEPKDDEGSDSTDNESYAFSKVPYVSDRLAQQIRLAGGKVLTTFEEVDAALFSQTYLVTNRPCITARFIKSLALGITISCHEWIINCTIKQKRLPVQELPAGWSIEHDRFLIMYQRKFPRPLIGMRIQLVQYKDQNFIRFWADIVKCMGACIIVSSVLDKSATVVVAEDGYIGPILEQALAIVLPVVSASWIVQTLIHGSLRPISSHIKYNHLYEETWEY